MGKIFFADLHHHTEWSFQDGYGTVERHAQAAKAVGHSALAMTEHGTMRGIDALRKACDNEDLRPIYGCEFYVARKIALKVLPEETKAAVTAGEESPKARREKIKAAQTALGVNERRHLVVIALTDAGLRNLIRLSNIAYREGLQSAPGRRGGFPRIDIPTLIKYSEGLHVSTACLGGVLSKSIMAGDVARARQDAKALRDGVEHFSLEIQPHPIREYREVNKVMVRLADELDIPLIATNDAHYALEDDWRTHDALIALATGQFVSSPDRKIKYHPRSFCLKPWTQMRDEMLKNNPGIDRITVIQGMARAVEIAEMANATLRPAPTMLLPQTVTNANEKLKELCFDGWDRLTIDNRASKLGLTPSEYIKRLSYELKTIKQHEFAAYFLIVIEVVTWCRERMIMVGPGRGSAAGSLVCFLTGITALDPIEHGLMFDRFLAPGRTDLPDIDVDIEAAFRSAVLEMIQRRWGDDKVAQIITINKMRGRGALKDVARVHGIPHAKVDAMVSGVVGSVTRKDEGEETLAEFLSQPETADFRRQHPQLCKDAIALENHIRHAGVHAGGVIISPVPLGDLIPLEVRSDDDKRKVVVTAFDKDTIESYGLIKFDFLGLKILSVIGTALRTIRDMRGTKIDINMLPLDDANTLQAFSAHDFLGVFQLDTTVARAHAVGVEFTSFEDLSAFNAVLRPGASASGLAKAWKRRKAGKKYKRYNPGALVEEQCPDTYGVLIYQEHLIKILRNVAGFDGARSDKIRKLVAKSKGKHKIEEHREDFVAGAVAHGINEREADRLFDSIIEFGGYGFNKSHSAAYSLIGYQCQWLKTNYPLAFFGALLSNDIGMDKKTQIARDASRRGVPIELPCVNRSVENWQVSGGRLFCGLASIKGVGEKAITSIVENQPFTEFSDLLGRVNRRVVHKGVLVALAKAGALRELCRNRQHLINEMATLLKLRTRKNWIDAVDAKVKEGDDIPHMSEEDRIAGEISVGVTDPRHHPLDAVNDLQRDYMRCDWTSLKDAKDGDLVIGILISKKVGTSERRKWARMEIEDRSGDRLTLSLNHETYERSRGALDGGPLYAIRIGVRNGRHHVIWMVDLLKLRETIRLWQDKDAWRDNLAKQESDRILPSMWDRLLARGSILDLDVGHPCRPLMSQSEAPEAWWDGKCPAFVTNVHKVHDRNHDRMAFVHAEAISGRAKEIIVFASVWRAQKARIGAIKIFKGREDAKRGNILAKEIQKV